MGSNARITAGTLAGAIVVVVVAILESVTSYAGHKVEVPNEVTAAFVTIMTFGFSWLLD
jgi:hypothetical protein